MSKLLSIIILCVGVSIHANAQSYTERVQQKQQGKGTVTIHQSKEIDDLVNDPTATGVQAGNQKPQASNQKPQTSSQTPAANNQQPQANNQQPQVSSLTPDANGQEPTTTATRKVTGYRVQAFAGGNSRKDRQTAEQISHNIKSQFPNISVYVHFYSPPCGQLPHLRGSPPDDGTPPEHGLQAGHRCQGQNNRCILIMYIEL